MDGWMERRISRQPIQHTAIQRSTGEQSHHSTAPTPSIFIHLPPMFLSIFHSWNQKNESSETHTPSLTVSLSISLVSHQSMRRQRQRGRQRQKKNSWWYYTFTLSPLLISCLLSSLCVLDVDTALYRLLTLLLSPPPSHTLIRTLIPFIQYFSPIISLSYVFFYSFFYLLYYIISFRMFKVLGWLLGIWMVRQ